MRLVLAKDVCDALGLQITNINTVLDSDEVMTVHYTIIGDEPKRGNIRSSLALLDDDEKTNLSIP